MISSYSVSALNANNGVNDPAVKLNKREGCMHSTNYFNTLICPAEDCIATAKIPEKPGSVAEMQYAILIGNPYKFTSDDILCAVAAKRKNVGTADMTAFRQTFFSKGQPCFRASPLTKTHGWAIHADANGHVALLAPTDDSFIALQQDDAVKKVNAMRSKRA